MSVFILPHSITISQCMIIEVVVATDKFHVSVITRFSFQAVSYQTGAKTTHQVVFIGIVNSSPQHLHLVIVYRSISCPIKIILVDFSSLYFIFRKCSFRMTNVSTYLIISIGIRIIGLHIISQPNKVLILLARCLYHNTVTWETAIASRTILVDYAVKAIIK